MIPLEITKTISTMNDRTLRNKINFLSYTLCVNADFTKTEAISKLIDKLEMHVMEALLRILERELDYRPYQNKIYEHVERIFDDQDSYNINRMMSSLRRTKLVPVDTTNVKYIKWMKNRVKYGTRTIMNVLCKELINVN